MGAQLSVADVLERAADILTPEGAWTQGAFAKDQLGNKYEDYCEQGDISEFGATCFCIFGAIAVAKGIPDPENATAGRALESILGAQSDWGVANWNDAPDRTQAEVVAKLREAASLARGDAS